MMDTFKQTFPTESKMLASVYETAKLLVYGGLDEATAEKLVMDLTKEESKLLNLVLVKMMGRFNGLHP